MKVSHATLVGLSLAIFAGAVWLFWPSVHGEFLPGDDKEYLQQAVRWNGLSWNAVKWAFTCTDAYYHPLVRLSHVLDYQIWGENAEGHHASSVFLHALNAALILGFLWALLGATPLTDGERLAVALWVALVFAIHPLQVESVSWISGRTQLLCTAFGIGCLWAYVAGAPRWAVWGFYVLALLCKPMAVSFPFLMLALDYYPLRRHERVGWARLVREKAVWIGLAAVIAVMTVISKLHQIGVATQTVRAAKASWTLRVSLMSEALTYFPLKLAWPTHLSPMYPIPWGLSLKQWPVLASLFSVVAITAVVVAKRRRQPMLAAAWGAYVALILPVSGVFVTTAQWVEQRHAYVAMLPLLLVAGGAGVWVWRRLTFAARTVLCILIAGQLCVFAISARRLIPDWHDDEANHRAIVRALPDSEEGIGALAMMLLEKGKPQEALIYAQRDAAMVPEMWWSHATLAQVLHDLGHLPEAAAQYQQLLRIRPDIAKAHFNLAACLAEMGRVQDAIEEFEWAIRLAPDLAEAHDRLGAMFEQIGQSPEAIKQYEQALQINPDYADAHNSLGAILLRLGRLQEAIDHCELALRTSPDLADAHNNLAVALARTDHPQEAIEQWQQALRIKPDFADAHNNLGIALFRLGRLPEAIEQYKQALRIKPDWPEVHCNLGNALVLSGRVQEAIEHYQQALKLQPDFATARNALDRLHVAP